MNSRRPLLLLLSLGAALCLAAIGCREPFPPRPQAKLIGSDAEYVETLKKVEEMTKRPLRRYEQNEPLSGDDNTLLYDAHPLILGLINHNPNAFGPRVLLAKVIRARNAPLDAIPAYEEALKLQPFNPGPMEAAAIADCRSDLAELFFAARDFDRAEDELREALRMRPDSVDYRVSLVQVLLEARRLDEAKQVLSEAEKRAPAHPGVRALRALISGGSSSTSPKAGETPPASP